MQIGISLPHFCHLASPEVASVVLLNQGILGVLHMVADLFYSTNYVEDATLDSMQKSMEVLAKDISTTL